MSKISLFNLNSEINLLNSALSKVRLNPNDGPVQIRTRSAVRSFSAVNKEKSHSQPAKDTRQPIRKILSEQRARKSLANPSSQYDINAVKKKYSIPPPASKKLRQLGAASYKRPKIFRQSKPNILPKQFRNDPLAEPPPITEKDVDAGIMNLIHRGLIPKDVDLTPAFERGLPPLQMKTSQLHDWRDMAPPPPPAQLVNISLALERISMPEELSFEEPVAGADVKALVVAKEHQRTYEQIIDEFSTHQLIFRNGRLLETPEFGSFKRINSERWGEIAQALSYAEEILGKVHTPLVYIDGKKFVGLIKDELRPIQYKDLIECIMNSHTIIPLLENVGNRFRSSIGKDLAAVMIQAAWRRFKAYSAYERLKLLMRKSKVIQNCLRSWKRRVVTRQRIRIQNESVLRAHIALQKEFESNYTDFKHFKRVEIHMFSTHEDLKSVVCPEALQSSQITRIFSIKDSLIDIILITPRILSEEIKNYYYKILEIGGIKNPKSRVTFLYPDILNFHSLHTRTSSLLYFSSTTLRLIKSLVNGRRSYIVPSKLSIFDVRVSVALKIPLLSGDFESSSKFSNKSELKNIFQLSDLPIPYSEVGIFSAKTLYQKLSLLVIQYREVVTWIIKLNNEENSRGLAYFNTSALKSISESRKGQGIELESLIQDITLTLPQVIKFVMPTLHKDWNDYSKKLIKQGCLIQSAPVTNKAYMTFPTVSFLLEPDGQINYIASADYLHSSDYFNAGAFFPQTSIPQEDIIKLLNLLSQTLIKLKLYGHFNLQLVAFVDQYSNSMKPVPWAVDLSFGINKLACSYFYFNFLISGSLDPTTGKYFKHCIDEEDDEDTENYSKLGDANIFHLQTATHKPDGSILVKLPKEYNGEDPLYHDFNLYDTREYLICWEMLHPNLGQMDLKVFFNLCRYDGISYDLERARGISFILYDEIQFGYLGCICVGSKRETILRYASSFFTFLFEHAGPPAIITEYNAKETRAMANLVAKVKMIEKKNTKAKGKKRNFEPDI